MSENAEFDEILEYVVLARESQLSDAQKDRLQDLVTGSKANRDHYLKLTYESLELANWAAADWAAAVSAAKLEATEDVIQPPARTSTASWLSQSLKFVTQPTPLSLTVAAVFMACVIAALGLFVANPRGQVAIKPDAPSEDQPIVAGLTGTSGAVWKDDSLRVGESLRKGRQLELSSGEAEITFLDGTRVLLAGPGRFVLVDRDSGSLHHGKLMAIVPKQATGFRIRTPQTLITDLGTEFGVQVSEERGTHALVVKGKVQVQTWRADVLTQPLQLNAGQSVHVQSRGDDLVREDGSHRLDLEDLVELKSKFQKPVNGFDADAMVIRPAAVRETQGLTNGNGSETAEALIDDITGTDQGLSAVPTLANVREVVHHAGGGSNRWWNKQAPEFEFDLGRSFQISHVVFWQYLNANPNSLRQMQISVSSDGKTFTQVGEIEAREDGDINQAAAQVFALGGTFPARYIRVKAVSNHGGDLYGASEFRFLGIPTTD